MNNLRFAIHKKWLLCFLGTISLFYSKAQKSQEESADSVVVIKEDPLIYRKNIIVEEVKSAKFYISGYYSLFKNYSYYKPCEQCQDFLTTYKSSITPKWGYSTGIGMMYAPNKIIGELRIGYSSMKEYFKFTDKKSITYASNNQFNYFDIALSGGYWLRRNKNISLLLNSGLLYSRLISASGFINDFEKPGSVETISASNKIRKNQYSFIFGIKTIFFSQHRMKFIIEPYYNGSIINVARIYYPYLELYNKIGCKAGLLFSI